MNLHVKTPKMTVEEFLVWADARRSARSAARLNPEPKWELFDGVPRMQQHELWLHNRVKQVIWLELKVAIERSQLPLASALDGIGVRTTLTESFQPDVVVFPVAEISDEDRFAPNPVIVVEVLSPSTRKDDLGEKVTGYGRVPSIEHYLVVDPAPEEVLHSRRGPNGLIQPPVPVASPTLSLDPPGLSLELARFFE